MIFDFQIPEFQIWISNFPGGLITNTPDPDQEPPRLGNQGGIINQALLLSNLHFECFVFLDLVFLFDFSKPRIPNLDFGASWRKGIPGVRGFPALRGFLALRGLLALSGLLGLRGFLA